MLGTMLSMLLFVALNARAIYWVGTRDGGEPPQARPLGVHIERARAEAAKADRERAEAAFARMKEVDAAEHRCVSMAGLRALEREAARNSGRATIRAKGVPSEHVAGKRRGKHIGPRDGRSLEDLLNDF
jgi:hypothetical protein